MRHSWIRQGIIIAGFGLIAPAYAQSDKLFIAGAEVSGHRSSYAQAGVIAPLPGSQLGQGWVARSIAHGLTYQYRSGPGDIEADAIGAEFTAGYQSSAEPGWWGLYTGPLYRHTSLSPKDPGSDARGGKFGWLVQAEGEGKLSPDVKVNLNGSYVFSDNEPYWTRVRFLYRIDGELFVGPEGSYQGDDDYSAWQLGVGLFGIEIAERASLGIKAGVRKTDNFNASPYGGLELGYLF